MKITDVEIVISAVKPSQYPSEDLPEFALAGRSNVGKSSFINKMINRKNFARTSSKPGKTQTLNFYLINREFYFVDVPGYGYAKVSKKERAAWGQMIESYLLNRKQLRAVFLIVDFRHPPTNDDVRMYEFLKYYQIPCIIIATKADKVSRGRRQKQLKTVKDILQVQEGDEVIVFSAETGEGKDEAWAVMEKFLKK